MTNEAKRVVLDVQKTIRRWMREWPFDTDQGCIVMPIYLCECEEENLAAVLALLMAKRWNFDVNYERISLAGGDNEHVWHVYACPNAELFRKVERRRQSRK